MFNPFPPLPNPPGDLGSAAGSIWDQIRRTAQQWGQPSPPAAASAPASLPLPPGQQLGAEGPPAPEPELDPLSKATLDHLNAQTAQIQAQIANEQDPARRNLLLEQLRLQNQQLQLEMAKLQNQMNPADLARLQDELAAKREAQRQQYEAQQKQLDRQQTADQFGQTLAQRQAEFGQQSGLEQARLEMQRQQAERQQALDQARLDQERQAAQDRMVLGMLSNQIAAGELSVNKASKMFDAYVQRARLPSEITRNMAAAMEPFLPYATSMKAGDIPVGFGANGPVQSLFQMAGASYNPTDYAVHPVPLDLKQLGKAGGANWSQSGKVPDPGSLFGSIQVPQVPPMVSNLVNSATTVGPLPSDAQQQILAALK